MIPDLQFVKESFARFNRLIFSDALPEPDFSLTRARTFRGKMVCSWKTLFGRRHSFGFEIRISVSFDLPRDEWEDVVIHEMIHYHIACNRISDTSAHGPVFRRMMREINTRHGRHITVSARSTDEQRADGPVRAHYLCLAKLSDGRLGVAPVAKTRIFELWDVMRDLPGVAAVSWVGAVDPWFNRFPRVMTPKLYVVSKEDLLLHLKGGLRLEREGQVIRPVRKRCFPDELLP